MNYLTEDLQLLDKNCAKFEEYQDEDMLVFLPQTDFPDKPYQRSFKNENFNENFEDDKSFFNESLSELISDKTGFTLTALTIAKSYIGVGCLAIPYGFNICGYQLALILLMVSAVLTFFCCWFMT